MTVRIIKRAVIALAVLILPLSLFSCSLTDTRRPDIPLMEPEANRLLMSLKQQRIGIERFRGIGKLKIRRKGRVEDMRLMWIGSQPGNLRMEAIGAWGQPLVKLLLKDSNLLFYSSQENRFYKSSGNARNISRFLSVPVGAGELFSIMSGQSPLMTFHEAKIKVIGGDGRKCLCLYGKWKRIIEKIWFNDDGKTVERVEFFDRWGNLKYAIDFSNYNQSETLSFPHHIDILHPGTVELSLSVENFNTDITIPDGTFNFNTDDVEIVDLDS